jgi:chitin-binding protein
MGGKKVYKMHCRLPERAGKHIIFCIWQRSDSGEAFYSCSDVIFTGGGGSGGGSSEWKQIGVVTSTENLPVGTTITFRLFDENLADIETIEYVILENQTAQNLWPFYLGQTVNQNSQLARIGMINNTGEIIPTEELNSNLVYILADRNLNFAIDKQLPPDNGGNSYDYAYPDNIGSYNAGTKVKGTDGNIYECKPFPYSGWCNQAPSYYAPGTGWNWEDAWILK